MEPVSQTAYYCCGVRAADAALPKPLCGDSYAPRFMGEEGQKVFARFASFKAPNASNVIRARIIDDLLRDRIATQAGQPVFLIGAGFDSRAYRLGGGRWTELDHPALLARKESLLPAAQCPQPLQRVPIDFSKERLVDVLKPFAGTARAVVVLEGVSQYLTQEQLSETLKALREALPGHTLICDLMSEGFQRKFTGAFRAQLRTIGTDFIAGVARPEETVTKAGYHEAARNSIIGRACELGALRIPRILLNTLLRTLRDGYRVHAFDALS